MSPTIHNKAKLGEIANIVLMPGDPLRAKYIAENFLSEIKLVNDIRCAYCYSGKYNNKDVSVMASGMGAGSMGIYSYELFNNYDVDSIIRVGSAGGINSDLKLGDIVLGLTASTDSGYTRHLELPGDFSPYCDYLLLKKAEEYCTSNNIKAVVGPVFSSVAFHYSNDFINKWKKMGILAIEMETAPLYINAALSGKKALAMYTVSDLVLEDIHLSSNERQTSFNQMINTALSLV